MSVCQRCQRDVDPNRFATLWQANDVRDDPTFGWVWKPKDPESVCFDCWDREHENARHAAVGDKAWPY